MNHIEAYLTDVISGKRPLAIDLKDDGGLLVGRLEALTRVHLDDKAIIARLTDWRNANMASFLTQFSATQERTRSWLEQVVFRQPRQLIFLIYAEDILIGHFGFKDLVYDSVLLDNAMRGERGGHPKLLQIAGRALIEWLFATAKVKTVIGYVLCNNPTAIMLNRQIGFDRWEKLPVRKYVEDGETYMLIGTAGESSPDNLYCWRLEKMAAS